MSLPIDVCTRCGHAVYPPRALCPNCGACEWRLEEAAEGIVEEVTARDDVIIATVRTELGPRVITRCSTTTIGATLRLDDEGGTPVARA